MLTILQRHKLCTKFAEALCKKTYKELTPIRVKELYEMEYLDQVFYRLDQKMIKGSGGQNRLVYTLKEENRFFLPGGLMFFKATQGLTEYFVLYLLPSPKIFTIPPETHCVYIFILFFFFFFPPEPWVRYLSRKTRMKYYDCPNKASKYDQDRPKEACCSFK
ncbi:Cap-specific mRNA (nucleoside-2'-O-)-methyltransferase 1 [Blattella germanica]|nr:Cap-specific mRNA (nucleoside-2'-O-)-methyltransferase 1 [Blattella germanica]